MRIHLSELQHYLRCPRSYKLYVIEGVEPSRKSLSLCKAATARRVISQLHKSDKPIHDFSRDEIKAICETVWQDETADPKMDRTELDTIVVQEKPATKKRPAVPAVTKSEKLLSDIATWCFGYSRTEFSSELLYSDVYFRDRIGDIEFCGSIDQVRKHPDHGIQVIVFNTGSQAPNTVYLEHDFSLSLYAHATWQGELYPGGPDAEPVRIGSVPSVSCFYMSYLEQCQLASGKSKKGDPKWNPMIPVSRDKEMLLKFEYELLYTASGIEMGFFPMMPTSPCRCSLCTCANDCGGAKPVLPDVSFNVEEFEESKESEEYKEAIA